MNNEPAPVFRRRVMLLGAVIAVAVAASLLWLRGADERRVNAACGTWLEHRGPLRTALSESVEAAERARADRAPSTRSYFNDFDATSAALRQWLGESPSVIGSLERSHDASPLERDTASAFGYVQAGITDLQRLIGNGTAGDVLDWIPEVDARFQMVDDQCLAAARRS